MDKFAGVIQIESIPRRTGTKVQFTIGVEEMRRGDEGEVMEEVKEEVAAGSPDTDVMQTNRVEKP